MLRKLLSKLFGRKRKRQFTGLYDKNGKEICEKDIVKQGSVLGKVFFEDGCFWVEWENRDEPDQLYWVNDEIEVIGNVYDNPELLERGR